MRSIVSYFVNAERESSFLCHYLKFRRNIHFVNPTEEKRSVASFNKIFPSAEELENTKIWRDYFQRKASNIHSRNAYIFIMIYLMQSDESHTQANDFYELVQQQYFESLLFFPLFTTTGMNNWSVHKDRGRLFCLTPRGSHNPDDSSMHFGKKSKRSATGTEAQGKIRRS